MNEIPIHFENKLKLPTKTHETLLKCEVTLLYRNTQITATYNYNKQYLLAVIYKDLQNLTENRLNPQTLEN